MASLISEKTMTQAATAVSRPTGYFRKREKTRAKLLDAAKRVMAGKGIEGTTIAEIAIAVGYSHASAFIKAFRLHHGVTPTELRRRHRGVSREAGNEQAGPAGRPDMLRSG